MDKQLFRRTPSSGFSGQLKSFRPAEPDNLIGASDDNDALAMFLNKASTRSEETRRRYERETMRFTLFIYRELGIDYQSVRLKHLQAYLHFIQNLPERWLQAGIMPGKPDKALFKHSVKPGKSTDQIIDVLSAFFGFLEKNRYTYGNPAASLVRSGEKTARGSAVVRFFYDDEWQHLKSCLDQMPAESPSQIMEAARTRYIIAITYALALRESEITAHTCADIHSDGEGGLYLSVLGKGRKRRRLPINESLYNKINDFRLFQGVGKMTPDSFPLAPRLRRYRGAITPLSSRGLRFWWQSFMGFCSENASEPLMAARLKEIPFHSLRHTALTHLAKGVDIEDLAIFAGHDSINTTSQYYHAEAKRLRTLTAEHGL